MTTVDPAPKLGWDTKIAYALGFAASSVEARGLSTFVLIFYNQVVGLPPALVSTVMLMLAVLDVVLDPTVGHVSDHLHSRWGRRHPFMYAAVLPVAISYILLWCPPESWSHGMIFIYLVAILVVLRIFGTMFELPSLALLPELTQNYNDRTNIIALRTMFGLVAALGMNVLAYQVLLKETPIGRGGVLARDGYFHYGLVSAGIIAGSMLAGSLGTHRRIPYLRKPRNASRPSLGAMAREVAAMSKNPSFGALMIANVMFSVAAGTKSGLELYFNLYFWQLRQTQMSLLLSTAAIGTLLALAGAPWLARWVGKRFALIIALAGALIGNGLPVLLRFVGLMPANGTSLLFGILFVDTLYNFTVGTALIIYMTSMLNDVVEDIEVKTGHRSEGLLMAADNLCRKLVGGFGIFISGMVLTLIAFPRHAERTAVAPQIVNNLAYAYIPVTLCYFIAIISISLYRIDRNLHEANLRALQAVPLRPPVNKTKQNPPDAFVVAPEGVAPDKA